MIDINFGECAICRQGLLIAVKDLDTNQIMLMCDDCASQWLSPKEAKTYHTALKEERSNVRNATLEEIISTGWEFSKN